jgi:catechol 2,3-dioxygenase-like lactoylglutathione lyase family enzyme
MARIRHIAFIVKEPQKLFDFYDKVIGVEEVRRSPTGSIHLIDGFFNLALLQQVEEQSDVINTHRADGNEVNQRQGINHFGFIVDKLDDVLGKLDDSIQRGESPQNGRPAEMRVIDPWGNNFDLSSRGFLGREEKKLPGIRHMVMQVDRPDRAAEFYSSALDMREVRRDPDGSIVLTDGDITMGLIDEAFIGRSGIQYFGLQVDSWSVAQGRFKDAGMDLPDLRPGQTEARVRDPEGNLFVVSEQGWGA